MFKEEPAVQLSELKGWGKRQGQIGGGRDDRAAIWAKLTHENGWVTFGGSTP